MHIVVMNDVEAAFPGQLILLLHINHVIFAYRLIAWKRRASVGAHLWTFRASAPSLADVHINAQPAVCLRLKMEAEAPSWCPCHVLGACSAAPL